MEINEAIKKITSFKKLLPSASAEIDEIIDTVKQANMKYEPKIPEGYEIDEENSTFRCIRFKPIKSLTYNDICKIVFAGMQRYYITNRGCIYPVGGDCYNINEALTFKQLHKVLATNQLLNIAIYYNKGWIPNWKDSTSCKYVISYNKKVDVYEVDFLQELNYGCVCFKNEEDAQAVIDNPNFRSILDDIFKN